MKDTYKYKKLKSYFTSQMDQGLIASGAMIEPETILMEKMSLSRNTVRQAIKELETEGYLYRVRGKGTFIRNVNPGVSRKIALVVYSADYCTHPVTAGLIRGIDSYLSENGYLLDILASQRNGDNENIVKLADNYAGFLIAAYQVDDLTLRELVQKNIPHLFVKNYPEGGLERAATIDYELAGFLACEHLIKLGHQELSLLYAGENVLISRDFKKGVVGACLEYGARLRAENIINTGFTEERAAQAVGALFENSRRPTAVMTMDDNLAAAVVRELQNCGVAVPGQMSVVGCNNTDVARFTSPGLTTIDIPTHELGRQAAALLLASLKGESAPEDAVRIAPSLVVRQSTASLTK